MVKMATIDVTDQDLLGTLQGFFRSVLEREEISAIMAPCRLPMRNRIMPTLVSDPRQVNRIDPLSPAFPLNSAKVVSRLTRKAEGRTVAAVMRPCEIRAFIELVKLNQGQTGDLLIIGGDCLGAYANRDYFSWVGDDIDTATRKYAAAVLGGSGPAMNGCEPAAACRVCEQITPHGADIVIGLLGMDGNRVLIQAATEKGEPFLAGLQPAGDPPPPARQKAIDRWVEERTTARDRMHTQTLAATDSLEKLAGYLDNCVNCYNCRVACPVCYCRECVFVTDVFDHDPAQYLRWADRKGSVKMPTDTMFYHLTRLVHMSTACVGCGQCSNACPNDIPVMELFDTVAHRTQQAFGYRAGRDLSEKPPLSEFREDEFPEVVGLQ